MHKGKKKSSEVLLCELRSVIKQYECTLTETIDLNLVSNLFISHSILHDVLPGAPLYVTVFGYFG